MRAFDVDNHYYESADAFTRHLPKSLSRRGVQWIEVKGKPRLLIGGRIDTFIPNPTFDPVAKPGAMDEYFRGRNESGKQGTDLWGDLEPIKPEYRDREVRLKVLDAQEMDGCVLFPTQGVGIEERLVDDPEALVGSFVAFNRWLEDDWGYDYADRLFAAPMITLVDLDAAIAELDRVLALGAKILCFRAAPVRMPDGPRSPADPTFDPFWARVEEAGVVAAFHAGDAGYHRYDEWETSRGATMQSSPFRSLVFHDRPAFDLFASLVCHRLFERFPKLRVASVEMGSEWVPSLLAKLEVAAGRFPGWFAQHPVESFREHVWVAPFYEDDLRTLKDLVGIDRILFGSDWPHAEGLADPLSFARDLANAGYSEADIEAIMVRNTRSLLRLPTGA